MQEIRGNCPLRRNKMLDPYQGSLPPFETIKHVGSSWRNHWCPFRQSNMLISYEGSFLPLETIKCWILVEESLTFSEAIWNVGSSWINPCRHLRWSSMLDSYAGSLMPLEGSLSLFEVIKHIRSSWRNPWHPPRQRWNVRSLRYIFTDLWGDQTCWIRIVLRDNKKWWIPMRDPYLHLWQSNMLDPYGEILVTLKGDKKRWIPVRNPCRLRRWSNMMNSY